MTLLDSNVFIYLAKGTIRGEDIEKLDICHASITRIETLGYSQIAANELILLEALLDESYDLPLTDEVIRKAIRLRQQRQMSLGDAIVAATALVHGHTLWTANIDDFSHIHDLELHDPLVSG